MSLEGFEKFYFKGTGEQKKELIEIHERNGCPPVDKKTCTYPCVGFTNHNACGYSEPFSFLKQYTEAKAYLLRFAKPVMPDKVAKPKRKKSVAFNQGFVIDGARYTKTHIHGVSVERVKQEIRTLRLKLDRHTRLDKAGALDNR